MPHVTEHTPKVSTRSVKPYACESSREKRQQDRQTARQTDRRTDRQTDRHTHRRIVQNHFSRRFGGCTSQIRSYFEVDFLHDANTSIDMEVIMWLNPSLPWKITKIRSTHQKQAKHFLKRVFCFYCDISMCFLWKQRRWLLRPTSQNRFPFISLSDFVVSLFKLIKYWLNIYLFIYCDGSLYAWSKQLDNLHAYCCWSN